jgi:hypothetical protein
MPTFPHTTNITLPIWMLFGYILVVLKYMLQHYIYGEIKQIFNNNLIEYY